MSITKRAFINALGVALYIGLLTLFFQFAENVFGQKEDNMLMPMVMLLLLVVSASITGGLVLAKPTMMYLDGQKPDAFKLFFTTIGWLVLFLAILVVAILIIS